MAQKALTLSIVIPVFNEERYIKACLDSIAAQTVKLDEVIVVDNNSTDKTVLIAKNILSLKFYMKNANIRFLPRPRDSTSRIRITGQELMLTAFCRPIGSKELKPFKQEARSDGNHRWR